MLDILTYEAALEKAREVFLGMCGMDELAIPCPDCLKDLALFAFTCAAAEASEEVCVCGHIESNHFRSSGNEKCFECEPNRWCQRFLSRKAALREEIEKAKR